MEAGKQFARSLYFSNDLKKGETISTKDIRSVRPGYGLHPKYFDEILGKKVIENVEKGDRVNFDIIK